MENDVFRSDHPQDPALGPIHGDESRGYDHFQFNDGSNTRSSAPAQHDDQQAFMGCADHGEIIQKLSNDAFHRTSSEESCNVEFFCFWCTR